jgi:hypothetical protein
MGVMPETLGQFDPRYAHEFLAFIARMFGASEATRRRVNELLAALILPTARKRLGEYPTSRTSRAAMRSTSNRGRDQAATLEARCATHVGREQWEVFPRHQYLGGKPSLSWNPSGK